MRELITDTRDRFWRPEHVPLDHDAALRLLGQLHGDGELRRVRPGLYWRGRQTRFGMTFPTEDELLDELLPAVVRGPCGPSAANQLGLSTQVPGRSFVAVCARPIRLGRAVVLRDRSALAARQHARLTRGEVAALEVLRDDRWTEVGRSRTDGKIADWISAGHLRAGALQAAAEDERAAVRRRLGALLG